MFRSVLLVVDTACVGRVIARGAQLPIAPDATLTLVEVKRHAAYDRCRLGLHALTLVAPRRRIRCVSIGVLDAMAVRDLVRSTGTDLVVVGDIRFLGWRIDPLIGTVPVLFARGAYPQPYRRPVVALAPRGAEEVLQFARRIVANRAGITAVHAYRSVAEQARRFIASVLSSLGAIGAGWTRYLGHGDPRSVISDAAAEARADLVVIGCRRRMAISRALFGSVSRSVIRDIKCDVLTVPVPRSPATTMLQPAMSRVR